MSSNSLFAVLGDDDYLVRQRAKEIFEGFSEEFPDDLSREIVDGRADRVDDVRILSSPAIVEEFTAPVASLDRLVSATLFKG